MPTPQEALRRSIARWEGEYQNQVADPGNYVTLPNGERRNVGTMRGVTPAVLAAYRGIPLQDLTPAIMKSVTLDEAARIGLTRYYEGTGLDLLAWGPATEALVDFAWGSGPHQAALSLQRLVGVAVDGVIGPLTVDAYAKWVAGIGWEAATRAVRDMRVAFYDLIIQRNSALSVYRQGWRNRANWMTPETAEWWAPWQTDPAAAPAIADKYSGALPKPIEPAPVLVPEKPKPLHRSRTLWTQIGQWISGGTIAAGGLSLTDVAANVGPAQALINFAKANVWILVGLGAAVVVLGVVQFLIKLSERRAQEVQ